MGADRVARCGVSARLPATMRDLVGDAVQAIHYHGEAVQPVRHQLRLNAPMPQGLVLVPLRAGTKLVGVLGVIRG